MCTYHFDENRMNAIQYSFANSIIERVRFCARLKTFSEVATSCKSFYGRCSMSDMFLQQYDSLPKKLQREVQDYVEYLFFKAKTSQNGVSDPSSKKAKSDAFQKLLNYTGCLPADIDYKREVGNAILKKYESLT